MGLIILVNSDKQVKALVSQAFKENFNREYKIQMMAGTRQVMEALNFELPELVLLNCSDPAVSFNSLVPKIEQEAWLHGFGIIGLFNGETTDEHKAMENLKNLNVLVMLDYSRIKSHLNKCVDIILKNLQLIYHREISSKLVERSTGSLTIENDTLAVPIYSGMAVTNLVQQGYLKAENKMPLQLSISELIINGIEHGNCGISYEEKTDLMEQGQSVVDIVLDRCKDPAIAAKRVHFEWEIDKNNTSFIIRDEGSGFDVEKVRKIAETDDPFAQHGRGIKMAEALCRSVTYNDIGNRVTVTVEHDPDAVKKTPQGLSEKDALFTTEGDVIFREGESGSFLYYISSGRFSVLHKGSVVGTLTPSDVFIGEMSFLLNNKRSATVRADEPGKLIKINRKVFIQVMKQYPHYGIFLSKLLARKLVRANEKHALPNLEY